MADRSKLIDRVVKLFRLGDKSANTTEAEMMLAVTKARQLMAEHGISMADIETAKGGNLADRIRERIKHATIYTRKGRKLADYDWWVAWAVEALTDTKVYRQYGYAGGETVSVAFLGDEDDVALAGELFHILLQTVRKMARRQYGSGNIWNVKHTSYAIGVAQRLQERAQEMVDGLNAQQQQQWGLVVATKKEAIKVEWNKLFPPPRPLTEEEKKAMEELKKLIKPNKVRIPKRDREAYLKGHEDGATVNLSTKVLK